MVILQNRSFPCLIDTYGVITGMMYRPLLTLVICHQAFWWFVLSSGMASSICLQIECHLRQALNGSVIQGISGVSWGSLFPLYFGRFRPQQQLYLWLDSALCTMTPQRSWTFVLQSVGYLTVTTIARVDKQPEPAAVTGNSMISCHRGHRNLFTLLCKFWSL